MTAYPAPAYPKPDVAVVTPALPVVVAAAAPRRARRPLSAIVTTFNEAAHIADCLASLAWCDEILVVDSHSTDATRAIARRFPGVTVLERSYYGAASQKNWAIDRCRHDWVLILDADERVTPELRREIEALLAAPQRATAYALRRRTFALGRQLRYSGWQHDRVVRLFSRTAARYPNRRVHADMQTLEEPVRLAAALDHHMVEDLAEYAARTRRYASWGAAQLWRDGRRAVGVVELAVRPAWRFLRTYLLQLGVLEGRRGLAMCAIPAWGTFLKYATLRRWRQELARGRGPELPAFDDDPAVWAWRPQQQPTT
jgi:glycosyltransferase involved in cell wall biosynthesis